MTDFLAFPPAREVRGTIQVPPSKSATNRAFVLAALSERAVEIVGPLESDDTDALLLCLARMGATAQRTAEGVVVHGPLSGPSDREVLLDAQESGTAARFLAALASAVPGRFLLTGSPRLRERPMSELVAALRSRGVRLESAGEEDRLPLSIVGGTFRPGRLAVDASRSSQFVSALMLAGVAVEGGLEVEVPGPNVSAPYVAMTLDMLRAFGHEVAVGTSIRVARGRNPIRRYQIWGDFSSALPLLAAAGVVGGEVTVQGLAWPSPDPDALALPLLRRMGLAIETGVQGVRATRSGASLRPVTARLTDSPDAVSTLAALAAFAPGQSRFEGIAHLRVKESDRIGALAALLSSAKVKTSANAESLVVEGPAVERPAGARRVPTFRDHRIAMAGALLALRLPGLLIENPECVSKSYPNFFRDLESIVIR